MQQFAIPGEHPELKEFVAEASRALARLDADRLEELALSCQTLNRDLAPMSPSLRQSLALQSREAEGDMATFSRVLDVTRANLDVMNKLREMRQKRIEYSDRELRRPATMATEHAEIEHGDN